MVFQLKAIINTFDLFQNRERDNYKRYCDPCSKQKRDLPCADCRGWALFAANNGCKSQIHPKYCPWLKEVYVLERHQSGQSSTDWSTVY